jgi:hypothetical protein
MPEDNRDYISAVMAKQGIDHGQPRKYLVLRGWTEIVDVDRSYVVQVPPLPERFEVGAEVYTALKQDNPDLSRVKVVEDCGDELVIQPMDYDYVVRIRVAREDIRQLPIPYRPLAILRRDLRLYVGEEAARLWQQHRDLRRGYRPSQ